MSAKMSGPLHRITLPKTTSYSDSLKLTRNGSVDHPVSEQYNLNESNTLIERQKHPVNGAPNTQKLTPVHDLMKVASACYFGILPDLQEF